MSNLNNHDDESNHDENSGRRKFVRAIGVAVPVTLTISARSALAGTCTTVSAAASIALANSHNATGDVGLTPCAGLAPSVWVNQPVTDLGIFGNQRFVDVLLSGTTLKMKQILISDTSNSQATDIVKHLAAAYVNLQLGKVAAITYSVTNLQDMWGAVNTLSPYHPVPGVNWYEGEIMAYLATTWS